MFACLDPATWQGREYDNHSTPLSAINPTQLDTDQWCRAAKLWGAKEILFVAKHTGGFCWWQTETTKYGIKDTAWKGGKGDVLAELADACRRNGLTLGIYVYPGDDTWGAPMGSGGRTKDPSKQEAYNQVFRQQLTEVLTRYGKITEVWFDGSCVIDVSDILKQHAAEAVIFQGPSATIRWPGTESGKLPYPAWNSLTSQDLKTGVATAAQGNPDGDAWAPLEADTTLYDHNWFWAAENEKKRKSLNELMDIYYKSAGHGGVLLLNSTPNTNGLIPDGDLKLYEAFGKEIERRFSQPVAEVKDQRGASIELVLPQPTTINHAVIMEDYREGERIREYIVEGLSDGQWKELSQGTSVGRKKIDRFRPAEVSRVRLRVTRFAAEPIIRRFAVFQVEGVSAGSLTTGRPTTASAFHSAPYVAAMATDDDPQTRWGCPDGTTACWLEVDLGVPTAFGRVSISELADRIRKFTLEYRDAHECSMAERIGRHSGRRGVRAGLPHGHRTIRAAEHYRSQRPADDLGVQPASRPARLATLRRVDGGEFSRRQSDADAGPQSVHSQTRPIRGEVRANRRPTSAAHPERHAPLRRRGGDPRFAHAIGGRAFVQCQPDRAGDEGNQFRVESGNLRRRRE